MALDPEYYKKKLIALREELTKIDETGKDSRKPVELDQTTVGRLSRMDAMQQQEMALATSRRREVTLQRIEQALKHIDDESYGYCSSCDEEIDEKRLEIDPTTFICVECME